MSETIERPDSELASKPGSLVVICSPKGGTGKTSLARNLLVAAGQADISSLGIDFDQQGSLLKWQARRSKTREMYPTFVPVEVVPGRLMNWRAALKSVSSLRLVLADLPPTVEHDLPMVTALCAAADFVLVPTSATADDLDSVLPWMRALQKAGCNAAFVMNRVNRQTKTFASARTKLIKTGAICPIEIPSLEDMHNNVPIGLSLLDSAKSRGLEPVEGVWAFLRREAHL
jgi:chromosome partitioning protein